MAGAKYSVDVQDSGVMAKIRAMMAAAENLQPLHERIGAAMVSKVQLGFKTGTSPYGASWAPLKIRQGQPLRDTRRLLSSINQAADPAGVTVGTNVFYAAVHQFGATIKPKKVGGRLVFAGPGGRPIFAKGVKIPARPFLPLDSNGATNLPNDYQRAIVQRIRAHFAQAGEV